MTSDIDLEVSLGATLPISSVQVRVWYLLLSGTQGNLFPYKSLYVFVCLRGIFFHLPIPKVLYKLLGILPNTTN